MSPAPPNGQPASQITPQLTPFTFATGSARADNGQPLVIAEIHMLTGMVRLFMTPADAERMARQWLAEAQKMPALIIPSPVLPPNF
jgi:hypothetical protein